MISILNLILQKLKHIYRFYKYDEYRSNFLIQLELKRINTIPRYKEGSTQILGNHLKFVDSSSFHFIYREVFKKEIYKFNSENNKPYIIDAGANIGLSVIYFKLNYPDAEVVAFEPDKRIFEVLYDNIQSFGIKNVNLVNKAVWITETEIEFYSEGADAGRVVENDYDYDRGKSTVLSESLKKYIFKQVDLLKIDIEGAEVKVIEDCKDVLCYVQKIFIEYHSFVNQKQELSVLIGILEASGFRIYINTPFDNNRYPFIEISNYLSMDNLINIYAYRTI
jgi:FkbM family methyltransferase